MRRTAFGITCCMAVCAVLAHAQEWERLLIAAPSPHLYGVCILDELRIAAVGEFGGILLSEDGGQSWQISATPTTHRLRRVRFATANIGWAVGDAGTILRTIDGGRTWTICSCPVSANLRDIWEGDGARAIAIGGYGFMLATNDAGQTWETIREGSSVHDDLLAIDFADSQRGCAVGGYSILRPPNILTTTDGGLNWEPQLTGYNTWLDGVCYVNDSLIVAVGRSGRVLRSLDSGGSWDSIAVSVEVIGALRDVVFADELRGVAVSDNEWVFSTADGGLTWSEQFVASLQGVSLASAGTGVAVGGAGPFLTSDFGQTWTPSNIVPAGDVLSVKFLNPNLGWLLTSQGDLLTTEDGGDSWQTRQLPALVSNLFRTSPLGGVALLADGQILRTTNNGESWINANVETAVPMLDVFFANELRGWAVGNLGVILGTRDGGQTWHIESDDQSVALTGVHATDTLNAWAVGAAGSLRQTHDGGSSWTHTTPFIHGVMRDVFFFDDLHGLCVGDAGYYYRTTDGGATWTENVIVGNEPNSVEFQDENTGWMVGSAGTIRKTIDSGNTWELLPSLTVEDLHSVAVSGSDVWVCGSRGTVLRGALTSPAHESPVAPEFFTLSVYPNPFNSVASVHFELPQAARVELNLYDILGRHALSLADARYGAGSHTLSFEANHLATGLYFMHLRTADFSITRKLLLVR